MATTFLRRSHDRYSKLGKGRKKKKVWRKPTGRDNKMREKRKGYPAVVSVGYKSDKKISGKLEEKEKVYIYNLKDLKKIGKDQIGIIGNIGIKKKIEIAKEAKKEKIKLQNMNPVLYLKQHPNKQKAIPTGHKPDKKKQAPKEINKKWI